MEAKLPLLWCQKTTQSSTGAQGYGYHGQHPSYIASLTFSMVAIHWVESLRPLDQIRIRKVQIPKQQIVKSVTNVSCSKDAPPLQAGLEMTHAAAAIGLDTVAKQ